MPSQKQLFVDTPKASNNKNKNDNSKKKCKMITVSFQSESTQSEQPQPDERVQPEHVSEPVTVTQTRSGHISKPPDRLIETGDWT